MLSDWPLGIAGFLVAALLPGTVPVVAGQRDARVEVEPIRCWWRSDAGDVRVGEPFHVLLTCALLETAAARTILDASRLEPGVVQLQPFDVLDGRRAEDLVTASRRFIQFQYRLRIVGDVFGNEASVPALQLTYRLESRVGETGIESPTGEVVQGRDLTYAMPALAVRVISTVPDSATDIREAPAPAFHEIERGHFRGLALRLAGAALFAVAALLALTALLPAARRRGQPADAGRPVVSDARILAAARRELVDALEHARRAGWSDNAVGRVLAALRIAGAYAANQPVSRAPTSPGAAPGEGQLMVRARRGPALVSAATTAAALGDRSDVAALRDALGGFTAARYGRESATEAGAARLDGSLERAVEAIDGLAGRYTWHAQRTAALRRSVADVRERLWAR